MFVVRGASGDASSRTPLEVTTPVEGISGFATPSSAVVCRGSSASSAHAMELERVSGAKRSASRRREEEVASSESRNRVAGADADETPEVSRLKEELRGYDRRVDELEHGKALIEGLAVHMAGRHQQAEERIEEANAVNLNLMQQLQEAEVARARFVESEMEANRRHQVAFQENITLSSQCAEMMQENHRLRQSMGLMHEQGEVLLQSSGRDVAMAESVAAHVHAEATEEIRKLREQWPVPYTHLTLPTNLRV